MLLNVVHSQFLKVKFFRTYSEYSLHSERLVGLPRNSMTVQFGWLGMFAEVIVVVTLVVSTCMTIDRNGLDKICIYCCQDYFEDQIQKNLTSVLEDQGNPLKLGFSCPLVIKGEPQVCISYSTFGVYQGSTLEALRAPFREDHSPNY